MIDCILLLSSHVYVNVLSPRVMVYTNKEKQSNRISRTKYINIVCFNKYNAPST